MEPLIKAAVEALSEGIPDRDVTTITVTARDPEGTLKRLLECIKKTGNGGHSFSIVVDPDESRGLSERRFFWDGDGADAIRDIK